MSAASADSRRNTGSEVYWAIPSPRANGSEPRSRSRGRHPSMVVSSVTTRAEAPIPAARLSTESTSSSEVDQYIWNHRGVTPSDAATSSIATDAWCESTTGTPRAAAARATARSASR